MKPIIIKKKQSIPSSRSHTGTVRNKSSKEFSTTLFSGHKYTWLVPSSLARICRIWQRLSTASSTRTGVTTKVFGRLSLIKFRRITDRCTWWWRRNLILWEQTGGVCISEFWRWSNQHQQQQMMRTMMRQQKPILMEIIVFLMFSSMDPAHPPKTASTLFTKEFRFSPRSPSPSPSSLSSSSSTDPS